MAYQNDFEFVRLFKAYTRIFDFDGRSTRTELAGYWIATWLLSVLVNYASMIFGSKLSISPVIITTVLSLIILLPAPGLAIRRAHDIGWPGYSALLLLVPAFANATARAWLDAHPTYAMISSIAYICGLLMLVCQPDEEANRYGPNPRLADVG